MYNIILFQYAIGRLKLSHPSYHYYYHYYHRFIDFQKLKTLKTLIGINLILK